jgi:hypothetical protein
MIADRVGGEDPRAQRLEDPLPRYRIEACGRIADAQQRQRGVARDMARACRPQGRRAKGSRRRDGLTNVLRGAERLHEAVGPVQSE